MLKDETEKFVPESYFSRLRDLVDVPQNPKLYKLVYEPLKYQCIPAVIRSHHLEYLHHSMNSRTKQVAMNKLEDNLCHHCGTRATTDHVLN